MAQYPVFPDLKQYPGSVNMQIENGKAMPTFDHGAMTNSADTLYPFIRVCMDTTNPAGNPRHYSFANKKVFYFEDGARTDDFATNQAGAPLLDVVTGAAIVEGPPFTNTIGVKKLLLGFGNSSSEHNRLRTLTTDTTPWTTANTAATQASFWQIITVGADVFAVTGAAQSGTNIGLTQLGEWHIAKCPYGSDPSLAASYTNVLPVGTPEWPILDLVPLREAFCVSKADGLWYWNGRTKRFTNAMDGIKNFAVHPGNGKGMSAGPGVVWYPTADGKLFRFDGVNVVEETPWKSVGLLPRDAITSRVTAIADRGDIVAVRTEAFYNAVTGPRAAAALGLRVFTVTGVGQTVTEITTNVTDGSLATGYDVTTNSLGANATDKLVFGVNTPVEGFTVRVTRNPNSAVNSFVTPQCSNGSGGWTSLGTVVDGTILGTAGISLVINAFPAAGSAGYLGWTSLQSYDLSATDTFNSIAGLYWYRFSFATTTAFNGSATIDEIDAITTRGGWPNTGLISTTNNFSHRDRAGGLGHVYIGKRVANQIVWADTYAVNDFGSVWAMGWTSARSGTMTNGGNPLLLHGRYQQTIIAESILRDPSRTQYPKLIQGSSTKPFPALAFRNLQLGDPSQLKMLNAINVQGQFIQPTDQMAVYAWWDNSDKIYELGTLYGSPATFNVTPMMQTGYGRLLNFDIVFSDASQNNPTAPYIERVIVDLDDVPGTFDMPQQAAFANPETT